MLKFYDKYWNDCTKYNKLDSKDLKEDFSYKWPAVVGLIPKNQKITILDFGCGNAKVMHEIKKLNPQANFIGIDVSKIAIKKAKNVVPDAKFYVVEDGNKFPLEDSSIDFILAADVIEHVYHTEETLSELTRILKKNGTILITTPYHGLIKNILIALINFELIFDPTGPHIRFFTKKSLFQCIKQVGLTIINHGYYGRFFPIPRAIYVVAKK